MQGRAGYRWLTVSGIVHGYQSLLSLSSSGLFFFELGHVRQGGATSRLLRCTYSSSILKYQCDHHHGCPSLPITLSTRRWTYLMQGHWFDAGRHEDLNVRDAHQATMAERQDGDRAVPSAPSVPSLVLRWPPSFPSFSVSSLARPTSNPCETYAIAHRIMQAVALS